MTTPSVIELKRHGRGDGAQAPAPAPAPKPSQVCAEVVTAGR